MPDKSHPKRGSKGYSPRKRAPSPVPRFDSWPDDTSDEPVLQGFAGYKAGMTHVLLVDYRPTSTTSNQEVQEPVTVMEVPPMRVGAVRFYEDTPYGLRTLTEAWTPNVDETLRKRLPVPKNPNPNAVDDVDLDRVDDVRLLTYTQPAEVSGIPQKVPNLVESRVGGGDVPARVEFAKGLLGERVNITDFTEPGQMLDVASVTKGKGFQGPVKRWGVKLQQHKNSKNRRDAGNLGPFQPRFIRPQVPLGGQVGFHNRTEYNKRVLKVGEDGDEINPEGGFVNYGLVRNPYILLHGSIPGPTKRLVRFRHALRYNKDVQVEEPEIAYVSTASKQGR